MLARIASGPSGYDYRTFERVMGDNVRVTIVASAPMKSDAQG